MAARIENEPMGQAKTFAAKLELKRKALKARVREYSGNYARGFVVAAILLTVFAVLRGEPLVLNCLYAPMYFAAAVCAMSALFAVMLFVGLGIAIEELTLKGALRFFEPLVDTLPTLTAARALAVFTPPPGVPRLVSYR